MKLNTDELDYRDIKNIPIGILDALESYVNDGVCPGHFLRACLENNFVEAATRADNMSLRALPQIARLIYNHTPYQCWGDKKAVKRWCGS